MDKTTQPTNRPASILFPRRAALANAYLTC
jgi:hypothetical protein